MNPSIDLEAAKAAFFSSGGQLVVLEGFTYQPFRQRKHPEPQPKRSSPRHEKALNKQKAVARDRAAKVAELAKTMSCGEVAALLGTTKGAMWGIAAREGFKFFSPPKKVKPEKAVIDQAEADRRIADQIIALRDTGASRCRVTAQLGIGGRKLQRIIAAFDIDFPLKR